VIRIGFNIDLEGWRPVTDMKDKSGNPIFPMRDAPLCIKN